MRLLVLIAIMMVCFSPFGYCLSFNEVDAITGDTLIVLSGNGVETFKIKCMDTPFQDQKFFNESRDHLSKILLTGKPILIERKSKVYDYEGEVLVNGHNVCYQMISDGYAWSSVREKRTSELTKFGKYKNNPYLIAEMNAKINNVGIWSERKPIPPWESRLRKNFEMSKYKIVQFAFEMADRGKSDYQLCMEQKLGRGYEIPKVTFAIVGAQFNLISKSCGGDNIYKISKTSMPAMPPKTNVSNFNSNTKPTEIGNLGMDTYSPNSSGCSSDFDCGIGKKCVKRPLSASGVCMNSVDEFGLPNQNLPDLDSIEPNMNINGQCNFDLDCPIGFRCDMTYKACIK